MDKAILKIGYNTSVQIFGKLLSLVLSFVTIGLLTRFLGASGYGNFTLVFTYMSFFSVIADFGLGLTLIREIAHRKDDVQNLFNTYFLLKLSLVVLSTFLSLIFLIFFPYSASLKFAIIIGALAVGVGGLTGYANTIFQSDVRLDLVTLIDLITKFTTVVLISLFVILKLNFYSIVSTVLIGNLLGLAFSIFLLKNKINFKFKFDAKLAKDLFFVSLPVGFTSFFSIIYFKLDTIMISVMRNSAEVGMYSLSYKVLENIIVVWGFYMASVYPLLVKYKAENNRESFSKLFKSSMLIAIFFSVPIVISVLILSPFIIDIFAGKEFLGSRYSLNILVFSIPLLFINNIFYYRFLIKRKMSFVIFNLITALFLNLILNLIFIPQYGYIAASYITVVTELFLSGVFVGLIFLEKKGRLND